MPLSVVTYLRRVCWPAGKDAAALAEEKGFLDLATKIKDGIPSGPPSEPATLELIPRKALDSRPTKHDCHFKPCSFAAAGGLPPHSSKSTRVARMRSAPLY